MVTAALKVHSLSLDLQDKAIIRNLGAEFEKGSFWSIIGPNGAGKSTLLKCLLNIHRNWRGSIELFDLPLQNYTQRELAKHVAYVPQPGADQPFPYTVREFVRMGRYAYSGPFGITREGEAEAIDLALKRAEVSEFSHRRLDSLSGGERQKVYLAAALVQGGDLLLLDEPTAFLDYRHQSEVSEILHRINREQGTTILCVTHDVNTAMSMGGQILALKAGEVCWTGPAKDLACEKRLKTIFDTSFRLIDDPVSGLQFVSPVTTLEPNHGC